MKALTYVEGFDNFMLWYNPCIMEPTAPASPNAPHPKFVRWALMLGIVIILNVFFNVLVALALPAPDYNAYCPLGNNSSAATPEACSAEGGVWTDTMVPAAPGATAPVKAGGYCDMYAKCQPIYQAASDQHALYAFTFMIALGVLALLAGLMPIGSSIVSSGLSYGGVLALVVGSTEYWGTAGNWLRLAIATAGLLALLYIAWKRFKD